MHCFIKFSDATNLAIHATSLLARRADDQPVKIGQLAQALHASEAHLGKVMNRLAQTSVVLSKRGPLGGFVLGPRAQEMTLFDLYEMFDGPLRQGSCLLNQEKCPFGDCIFGDAVNHAQETIRRALQERVISQLPDKKKKKSKTKKQ